MSLVSNAIDAMFNGVSQQPANMRLPSQCEEQVNGYASVASGLSKRPPTEHLAKLTAAAFGDAFVHIINRDVTERYAVVVTDENLEVYDLADGTAENVIFEQNVLWTVATAYVTDDLVRPTSSNKRLFRCTTAGTSHATTEPTWDTVVGNTTADGTVVWTCVDNYLSIPAGESAADSFEIVTVADYSFIVNKTNLVRMRPVSASQQNNYNKWYFPDNWNARGPDERYYSPTPGTDKGKKQTLADLPKAGDPSPPSEGDFYEISGNDDTGFSRYYVIYRSGVWTETHERNQAWSPDEATMPHALVRETDGDFHFREFGWVPRLYGDSDNNPDPTFIGGVIRDLGYHKNRLVFATGENCVFSVAGDYGNFFRNTVTQLLDSDVVDVAVSSKEVSNVNYVLPAENGMMFFSDQTQFVLNVDQLLTPSTVSIDVATSYEMNPKVKPIAVGQDVYFVTETGDFSRLREYSLGTGDLETDATDVTAHVEKYLPKNLKRLAGSSNEDIVLAISSETGFKNRVYVYKYFYSGGNKVQSSWGYWEFAAADVIRNIAVLNNTVYFIIERTDGMYLETMNVQSTDFPLALTFDLLLDRRHQFLGGEKVFDSTFTTFTFPYDIAAGEQASIRLIEGDGATPGRVLDKTDYTFPTANTVKVTGDYTGKEIFGGLNYVFTYKFSEQFNRKPDGTSITIGRYQLRTFTIVYEDMAFFSTIVDPYGNLLEDTEEEIVTKGLADFTGKTLGESELVLDAPVFGDGTYSFQIYGNSKVANVTLTNDVPFGGSFVSCTVEGFFTNRGR